MSDQPMILDCKQPATAESGWNPCRHLPSCWREATPKELAGALLEYGDGMVTADRILIFVGVDDG